MGLSCWCELNDRGPCSHFALLGKQLISYNHLFCDSCSWCCSSNRYGGEWFGRATGVYRCCQFGSRGSREQIQRGCETENKSRKTERAFLSNLTPPRGLRVAPPQGRGAARAGLRLSVLGRIHADFRAQPCDSSKWLRYMQDIHTFAPLETQNYVNCC